MRAICECVRGDGLVVVHLFYGVNSQKNNDFQWKGMEGVYGGSNKAIFFFLSEKEKKEGDRDPTRESLLHVLQGQSLFCFWFIPLYKGGFWWIDKKRERRRQCSNGRRGFSYFCPAQSDRMFWWRLILAPGSMVFLHTHRSIFRGGKKGYYMHGSSSCDPRRNHIEYHKHHT